MKKKPNTAKKSSSKKVVARAKKNQSTQKEQNQEPEKPLGFFKSILPSLILSLTISFMFFIFEPISMYATNPNDFWFDYYDIFPILSLTFLKVFLICFSITIILYLLSKYLIKKPSFYYVLIAIFCCIFFITYVQGNFLAGSLPGINGELFNWRLYKAESITSVLLWLISFIVLVILLVKFKPIKVFSYLAPITGAIFIMLLVSLISTVTTNNALENKNISVATYKNFNLASSKQNLFVMLVDAIDGKEFDQYFKSNKEYQELFKDFTFYNNTLSFYPFTRDSIPYIFSPIPNHNEKPFSDFSQEVMSKSKVFDHLKKSNFTMNFFDSHNYMDEGTALSFQNYVSKAEVKPKELIEQIIKYDCFKYYPYPLKGKAHIEKLDFSTTKNTYTDENYNWKNIANYQKLTSEPLELTDDKLFSFIYTEGAHVPFDTDENFNTIDTNVGTYYQKITATFKLIKAFINRLKKAGAYDNSSIVILADHGYEIELTNTINRFNPILYIKGVNEKKDKMAYSDKPIEFSDLENAFIELSDNKTSDNLFEDISSPRLRTFILYEYTHEDHMVEYQTEGKAWESDKMRETGNVYDLEE